MSEIDKAFERLETPPASAHSKVNTESARRRSLELGRHHFRNLIYNHESYTGPEDRVERYVDYRSIAVGSFTDPFRPNRVNHLLAVPYILQRVRDQKTDPGFAVPIDAEYGINLEAVDNEEGPNQIPRKVGTYIISASTVAPKPVSVSRPATLEEARQFDQLCRELIAIDRPE